MGSGYGDVEFHAKPMSKINTKPKIINLSSNDLDGVKTRVSAAALAEHDKKIILSILTTYQWLYGQLQTAKFSLHRLKKIFGFSTEKRSFLKGKKDALSNTGSNQKEKETDRGTTTKK
jgi:hypothetical protein